MGLHCTVEYRIGHPPVCGEGRRAPDEDEFKRYLDSRILAKFKRSSANALLGEMLDGLGQLGFKADTLKSQFEQLRKPAGWEIGEWIAEALLADHEGCHFPWPMAWDKRTADASLPGADLVGYQRVNQEVRFLFGQVKTSGERRHPPSVVYRREKGLTAQLKALAVDGDLLTLIKWLCIRSKAAELEGMFLESFKAFLDGNVGICGVLVRDTEPEAKDIRRMCDDLRNMENLAYETSCFAYYLPMEIIHLPAMLTQEAS